MDCSRLGVAFSESGTIDDVLLCQGSPVVAGALDSAVAPCMTLVSGGCPPFEYLL